MQVPNVCASAALLALSEQNVALRAKLAYIKAPLRDEELYVYKYELPQDVRTPHNLQYDQVEVPIVDIRTTEHQSFNIEHNGFQIENFQVPADINWQNDRDVNVLTHIWQSLLTFFDSLNATHWTQCYRLKPNTILR